MRRWVALTLVIVFIVALAAPAAEAGHRTATNVALGLASFAVFNQLFGPVFYPRPIYAAYPERVVVVERPVYAPAYVESPVYYREVYVPAPTYPTVVQYPHGRYELRGDGVRTPYQWVWIPNPPPPPPAAPPPPAPSP